MAALAGKRRLWEVWLRDRPKNAQQSPSVVPTKEQKNKRVFCDTRRNIFTFFCQDSLLVETGSIITCHPVTSMLIPWPLVFHMYLATEWPRSAGVQTRGVEQKCWESENKKSVNSLRHQC